MSLEARIVAAVQAIGLDIKALFSRALPAGGATGQVLAKTSATDYAVAWQTPSGGGGGASWQRVVLDVPAGQARFKKVNLLAVAVTPASVVACQFFGGVGAAVNEADEVAKWTISATPLTGSIDFNLSCRGPFVGAVEILYKVQ